MHRGYILIYVIYITILYRSQVLLSYRIAPSRRPTVPSLLSFFVCPRRLCVRDVGASSSFLDSLVQDPSGPAPFLRIRAESRDNVGVKIFGNGVKITWNGQN